MRLGSQSVRLLVVALALVLVSLLSGHAGAQELATYTGHVQRASCAQPATEDPISLPLKTGNDKDAVIEQYDVEDDGNATPLTNVYYGVATVPGFSILSILDAQPYSLVITRHGTDAVVACGDINLPSNEDFRNSGTMLVQLVPVDSSNIGGIAIFESDETSDATATTNVRIVLSVMLVAATPAVRLMQPGH